MSVTHCHTFVLLLKLYLRGRRLCFNLLKYSSVENTVFRLSNLPFLLVSLSEVSTLQMIYYLQSSHLAIKFKNARPTRVLVVSLDLELEIIKCADRKCPLLVYCQLKVVRFVNS